MTELAICAALRLEALALQAGLRGSGAGPRMGSSTGRARHNARVVRIGVGPTRARQAAKTPLLLSADAIAIAGIAGGLAPGLAAGDVVVASEARTASGLCISLPEAPRLAVQLERLGLHPHVGPIASAVHVVTGSERARLAEDGTLCVDMESAWLLAALSRSPATIRDTVDGQANGQRTEAIRPGTPSSGSLLRPGVALGVVRVVADIATRPVISPGTAGRILIALRVLSRLSPALVMSAEPGTPPQEGHFTQRKEVRQR